MPPLRTILIDVESGSSPVADLVAQGHLTIVPAASIKAVEDEFNKILRGEHQTDVVVLDTIDTLANFTRQDLIIDPQTLAKLGLWAQRDRFLGDQRHDYNAMSDLISRLVRMLRFLPAIKVLILVCHEDERIEPGSGLKKAGPGVNPALMKFVIALSDVMVHLGAIQTPVEADGMKFPVGTRRLRLKANADYMAKSRKPEGGTEPPEVIIKPQIVLQDLLDVVMGPEEKGKCITLFGPSGSGKTTLACSGAKLREEG